MSVPAEQSLEVEPVGEKRKRCDGDTGESERQGEGEVPEGGASVGAANSAAAAPSAETAAASGPGGVPEAGGVADAPREPAPLDAETILHRRRPEFPYCTDRYYTNLPMEGRTYGGEQMSCIHLNGLVIVTLSENHPVVKENLKIVKVDFEVGRAAKKGESRLDAVKIIGKKKKGGVIMRRETVVADLYTECERKLRVHALVNGTMIELNEELLKTPDLVRLSYADRGWLAVIMPTPSERTHMERLLCEKGFDVSKLMLDDARDD